MSASAVAVAPVALYDGVVHGFTETKNGDDPSKGSAYNTRADKLSWTSIQGFFHDVIAG